MSECRSEMDTCKHVIYQDGLKGFSILDKVSKISRSKKVICILCFFLGNFFIGNGIFDENILIKNLLKPSLLSVILCDLKYDGFEFNLGRESSITYFNSATAKCGVEFRFLYYYSSRVLIFLIRYQCHGVVHVGRCSCIPHFV